MILSVALAAAALATGAADAPVSTTAAPPVATTVASLRANPAAFAGRRVRVSGRIDGCTTFSCNICADRACAAVSWRPPTNDAAMRNRRIAIIARFDPACWGPDYFCTDRASVLLDAVPEPRR